MGFRVHVRNFQSIEDATLDVSGFTVVTGQNNSGKTALMRAVRGVFTNPSGTAYVRHGCTHCSVEITFDDGNVVLWEKGDGVNRYTVNGKVFDKVGRGVVPDEVTALGIKSMPAGSQTLWPQIAPQFTGQVFLLDQSGSTVAEAVADVERVGKLTRALKASESDRRTNNADLKVRRIDEGNLVKELAVFDGLDEAAEQVVAVEALLVESTNTEAEITALNTLRDRLLLAGQEVSKLDGIDNVKVPTLADAHAATATGREAKELQALSVRLAGVQKESLRLAGIDAVRVPVDDASVVQKERQELVSVQTRHQAAKRAVSHWDAAHTASVGLDFAPPEMGQKLKMLLQLLAGIKHRMGQAQAECSRLDRELQAKQQEYERVREEVFIDLGSRGECPSCGTLVSADGQHQHGAS